MPNRPSAAPIMPSLRLLPAAVILGFASTGHAQTVSPYYIGVSQGFTHESNVYRTRNNEVSDTVSSTGVLAGIDQPLGRQRIFADVAVQKNVHSHEDQLDNVSYQLNTGLDWQTIERLSGNVRYSANRSLANYGTPGLPNIRAKNVETTQQLAGNVTYGITSSLALEGGLQHRKVNYSASQFLQSNYKQNVASAGVRFGGNGTLTFGTGLRVTKTDYENAPLTAAVFDPTNTVIVTPATFGAQSGNRKDIDFTTTYTPSPISSFTGRISLTREEFRPSGRADFSGVTGAVSWDYKPTAKLAFKTSLSRDTGTETTFYRYSPVLLPVRIDAGRISTLFETAVDYEVTAKVAANASFGHTNSSSGVAGSDYSTNVLRLGATWQVTRAASLGCNIGREWQSDSYTANTIGCSGQIVFR